jgi:hypothetical protein
MTILAAISIGCLLACGMIWTLAGRVVALAQRRELIIQEMHRDLMNARAERDFALAQIEMREMRDEAESDRHPEIDSDWWRKTE